MQNARSLARYLVVALCAFVPVARRCHAQSQLSGRRVVLEATELSTGFKLRDKKLLVRLTNDGNVQWDESAGNSKYERRVAMISRNEVIEIQRNLDAVDKTGIHGKMGPYSYEVDTRDLMRLRIASPDGERHFSVIDPWSNLGVFKPLPNELKLIICEASKLRAKMAKEPLEKICDPSQQSVKPD